MFRFFRLLLLLVIIASFAAASVAQEAAVAHRRTLAELIDESAYIVHGRVTDVRLEPHPQLANLNTVLVTMAVKDALKGDVSQTFTFRQFVWDVRGADSSGYRKGQELLLFIRPPSQFGLTSPAGLSQGRFAVHTDASGAPLATNALNNVGLFDSLQATAKTRGVTLSARSVKLSTQHQGAVPLRDFEETIRSLVVRSR